MLKYFILIMLPILISSQNRTNYPTVGEIERLDASLDNIIMPGAKPEIIADGLGLE
jgi:hypothetical protein